MSKNQKVAFWSMYIGFCFVAIAVIYPQGAFKNLELGGASLLVILYLSVALLIRWHVKSKSYRKVVSMTNQIHNQAIIKYASFGRRTSLHSAVYGGR